MNDALNNIKKYPLMYSGVLIIIASLGSGVGGVVVDPEKWLAGIGCGFTLIFISLFREWKLHE